MAPVLPGPLLKSGMRMNKFGLLTTAGLLVLGTVLMSQTQKPAQAKKPAAAAAVKPGLAASIGRGKQVYHDQCLACHQEDALGVQNMNPPLVKTKFVMGDKTALVRIVLKGMQGQDIDGDSYHNVMAAHADLSDQQIADVLTYIRNNFGNKASAVKAAEVKAIRAKTK